jgi:2-methylaconitate cis-trans-isomerase PrpF
MKNQLPTDAALKDKVILAIFGSPDVRQIDGLGGADALTSKLAIIGPATRDDADVDYTFGQVNITRAMIDYRGNCGNISAGVGPFAIDEGFVEAREPVTKVRIHQVNTARIIIAEVPVVEGQASVEGNYRIAGVPGSGAKIMLDFADSAGGVTGALLPTSNPKDALDVESLGRLEVSILDAANPVVFCRAIDIGLKGIETPKDVDSNPSLLQRIENVRGAAAELIGLVKDRKRASIESPYVPFIAFVSSPKTYMDFTTQKLVDAKEVDLLSRLFFMQAMHKTYPVTGTICTGVAAKIPGTIVNEVVSEKAKKGALVRIGHPAGSIEVETQIEKKDQDFIITRAAIGRTARRIMDGYVYVRRSIYQ